MSYATRKGHEGEKDVEKYLEDVFSMWKFRFDRRGGTERFKKSMHGDVCRIGEGNCVLDPYFLEVKRQATMKVLEWLDKAEDDGKLSGKRGAILFATHAPKNKVGKDVVVMTRKTFGILMRELQGYL